MTTEMEELLEARFDLSTKTRESVVISCPATDLLDEQRMKQLLQQYTSLIKGKEQAAGEVYMVSWLRGPMLGLMFMLTNWNKSVDLSLSNLTIQLYSAVYNDRTYYRCGFVFHQFDPVTGPEDPEEHAQWVTETWTRFFECTARPVLESIAKVGSQKIAMLWGQLPTSLEYGYEMLLSSLTDDKLKQRAQLIYRLAKTIDGEKFGTKKNPLDVVFRMTESLDDSCKQSRLKFSCCLYYLVEDGNYCYTCPRLKESEREIRRAEYRAGQQGLA